MFQEKKIYHYRQIISLNDLNIKKGYFNKDLKQILRGSLLLLLVIIIEPGLAIGEGMPCTTFDLKDYSNELALITRVKNNLQKDLTYPLPKNNEVTKIELCQQGIRHYSEQQIEVMAFLASVYYEAADFEQAAVLLEEILLFAEETKKSNLIILAHNHLGHIASINNFRLSAYFHYQKLLELGEENKNTYSTIIAYLNLGAFDFNNGAYEEAEKKYLNSLRLLEKSPNSDIENWVIHRMGELKRAQNKDEEAIGYLKKAVKYWEDTDQFKGATFSYQQLGVIHTFKNPDLAEEYYFSALAAAKQSDYQYGEVEMLRNLGIFYLNFKKYQKSLTYFEKVIAFDTSRKQRPQIIDTHKLLAETYSGLGMLEKANESHEKYLMEQEKYSENFLASSVKSIKDVERLILQKKEYELLQKEKSYTKERLFYQKILTFFSLVALALAVSLALIFFRKNKRNRAQKERLVILNQQNIEQAEGLTKAKIITENQKKDLEVEIVKKAMILSQQGKLSNQLLLNWIIWKRIGIPCQYGRK